MWQPLRCSLRRTLCISFLDLPDERALNVLYSCVPSICMRHFPELMNIGPSLQRGTLLDSSATLEKAQTFRSGALHCVVRMSR